MRVVSICQIHFNSLGYSYLKRELGMDAVGIRAGEVNKESKFALDYFGLEAPELVTSLKRKQPEDEKQKVILVDHNESKQNSILYLLRPL